VTSECFVYIALPGETDFVAAGRFRVDVDRHGIATGRFVYGKSYLARRNAVPIDPIELKLAPTTYETRLLKGIFGALRDASPDHWGRRVIEKHAGNAQLGEVDYLLHSPDDRAGALGFGQGPEPPAPRREFNRTIDLQKLQDFADKDHCRRRPSAGCRRAAGAGTEPLSRRGSVSCSRIRRCRTCRVRGRSRTVSHRRTAARHLRRRPR
jgi:hypothetical protein